VLAGTVIAILGGPILKWMMGGEEQAAYFAGLGLGFFMYAVYLGVLLILRHRGVIKNVHDYEFWAGCGGRIDHKELDMIELMIAVEEWSEGKITNEKLKSIIGTLEINAGDYHQISKSMRNGKAQEDVKILDLIEREGIDKELPDTPVITKEPSPKRRNKESRARVNG
jgi:hypothetical protein